MGQIAKRHDHLGDALLDINHSGSFAMITMLTPL
jgi:hypothetical protein